MMMTASTRDEYDTPERKKSKKWLFGLLIILYAVATFFAFKQPPRPNPFKPPTLAERLFSPLEQNAFMRLPRMAGNINDVFALPGGKLIWIVGDDGLIVHSKDGGNTWTKQNFPTDTPASALTPPVRATSLLDRNFFLNSAQAAVDEKAPPQNTAPQQQEPTQSVKQSLPSPPIAALIQVSDNQRDLNAIVFVDAQRGIAVGALGTLLKTLDGGVSWKKIPVPANQSLCCITFLNREKLLVAGNGGVLLKSDNAGDSWTKIGTNSNWPVDVIGMVFANEREGLVAGESNFKTTDGGATWAQQNIDYFRRITYLHNVDSTTIIAEAITNANKSEMALSSDHGNSWQPIKSPEDGGHFNFSFFNASIGTAVSRDDLWRTINGGKNWQKIAANTVGIRELKHLDENTLIAFRTAGGIVKSVDGGISWRAVTSTFNMMDIDFAAGVGIAVGESGAILTSTDKGLTWVADTTINNNDLFSVDVVNATTAIAAGEGGSILKTQQRIDKWQPVPGLGAQDIWSVQLFNSNEIKAILDDTIASSNNNGESWRLDTTDTGGEFSVRFFDNTYGIGKKQGKLWAIGNEGSSWVESNVEVIDSDYIQPAIAWLDADTALTNIGNNVLALTTDRGTSWHEQAKLPTDNGNILALNFFDKSRGLAVGESGLILLTLDGGLTWKTIPGATKNMFNAVKFIDAQTAVIAGDSTLLHSTDGGLSWKEPVYSRIPAWWYWLFTLILALCGFWFFSRKPVHDQVDESIADLLASDRPLRPGDPDPLEFGAIARGMSRFMRNPNTEPPLTLAITGAWGTGKSSLMNLLYDDLRCFGFTPVWFNAWHHQKGEQLLASLYANIRTQAIPGWFRFSQGIPVGLLFRINLLFRRSAKHWLTTLVMISLFVAAITYVFDHGINVEQLGKIWDEFTKSEFNLEKILIPFLGSQVALLFRGMRAFGLNPLTLITTTSGDKNTSAIDPSARQQFAREFNDVAKSLSLGRMVIFIDDLDRCSKENVVDILEAINFLSVSGDCYIVLGMDETWVKICVTQQFTEIAKNNADFAEQYLEKMINIKVPVPVLNHQHSKELLAPKTKSPYSNFEKTWLWLNKNILTYKYPLIVLAMVIAGFSIGKWPYDRIESSHIKTEQAATLQPAITWKNIDIREITLINGQPSVTLNTTDTTVLEKNRADSSVENWELSLQATPEALEKGIVIGKLGDDSAALVLKKTIAKPIDVLINNSSSTASSAANNKRVSSEFYAGQNDNSHPEIGLPLLAIVILLTSLVIYALRRPERQPKDSDDFKEALAIWQPWILLNRQTPRAIKRYLNRIRYIAMRFRPEEIQQDSFWTWLKNGFSDNKNPLPSTTKYDKNFEANLVALSAIYAIDKKWLLSDYIFEQIWRKDLYSLVKETFTTSPENIINAQVDQLSIAINKHQQKFGTRFISNEERRKFLSILADI